MIEQNYILDTIPFQSAVPVVHVSQYDDGSRTLKFALVEGGSQYDMTGVTRAKINGKKPDSNAFSYDMTITDNVVSIDVTEQMTAVEGRVIAEVVLFDSNDGVLGTANFIIEVEKSPIDEGIMSDSDIPIIVNFIAGGTAGQIFKSNGNGSGEWVDPSEVTTEAQWGGIRGRLEDQADLRTALNSKANLDTGGKVPSSELPSYVDDVLEYASVSQFPATGETGKIYVATDTNTTYRWSGSQYIMVGNPIVVDPQPVQGSANAVSSGGVYSALALKQNKLTFDTDPTENSVNPVTSGGIFLSQKKQDNKFDTLVDLFNAKYADDWATIQAMIQIGYGAKYYPVGTQFTVHHDVYGDILFDVIGHDHDIPACKEHSMTLLMHNVIYSTQFDEVEGFYYCENGLTAGTYNVTITRQPWFAGDVGKTFQFTLADDVPAGAILWWDGYNVSREGRTVRVYNTRGATSAAQTATMTEGNGGTALGSVDGTGNFNFFDRTVLGSNDWEESGVRQWLNADVASNWWEPKTNWDRLINYYSRPGFLYGFDADFKNVLVETTHGNRSNIVYDSHGTNVAYSTTEKIFLLCNEEVNLAQEQGIVCGTVYDYYRNATNADRIKYDITSTGTARSWWLRSPYPSDAYDERCVHTSGALNYVNASYGYGAVPACVIA